MSDKEKTAFPLCWPLARPKTKPGTRRTHTRFKVSFATARDECLMEISRLGGRDTIISTNVAVKKDGNPKGVGWGEKIYGEPGVAVYFKRKGKELCFACDCWNHVQDNMHAINLTIAALRGIARWGTGDMMEAAFTGFLALPEKAGGLSPWEILGVPMDVTEERLKEAYRSLAQVFHPDKPGTGNAAKFHEIKVAYDIIAQNLRGS